MELSWGALAAWRQGCGTEAGTAGLLLNAARSLFPLSVGSYARLLSSLIHTQVLGGISKRYRSTPLAACVRVFPIVGTVKFVAVGCTVLGVWRNGCTSTLGRRFRWAVLSA